MSRLAKKPIVIPEKTEVTLQGDVLSVKGPKGNLSRTFGRGVSIVISGNEISLTKDYDSVETRALWGTYAAHIRNMILGVNTPYEKKLILEGVGFKVSVEGKNLTMALGFSHPVKVAIPEGLTVTAEKNVISISGVNKDEVGQFASKIRSLKKPEPYKGKGFRYDGEVIRRKEGKKTA